MKITIHEAAALAGVTPKTLRYYDKLGLLHPAEVTASGYRLYGDAELRRLQEILLLRELEFPLREIAALLDVPDRTQALRRQRALLEQKCQRLEGIIALVDHLLKGDEKMHLETFRNDALVQAREAYAQEAKSRWGETAAYQESQRRDAARTADERLAIQSEYEHLLNQFASHIGENPACPAVQALIADWQAHITHWYYPCTSEMLASLGEMYTGDARFTKNIDAGHPGTAALMSAAIRIYCARQSRN